MYNTRFLSRGCMTENIETTEINGMFEIHITRLYLQLSSPFSMLATLASVGYLQGFAPRSAVVNGAAQASRSAAIMQAAEPGAGAPGSRDMKGDVITSAHRPPTPPDVHWPNTHLTAPVCALRRRHGV